MNIGYGLPGWLPDGFLTADETRALGERDLFADHCTCGYCGEMPNYRGLERAHIARKGLGGQKKGASGPTFRLCARCHGYLDQHSNVTLAISREGDVCWLTNQPGGTSVRVLLRGVW